MKTFSELFEALDTDNSTNGKIASLRAHFASATPEDAAWALYFLCGERLPSAVSTRTLRLWAGEAAGVAPWLFEECYAQVGDLAETIALLLPDPAEAKAKRFPLSQLVEERVRPLAEMTPAEQAALVRQTWAELGATDRFLYNKLLAGSFRVGVQKTLVTKALAETAGVPVSLLAGRLLGRPSPTPEFFQSLFRAEEQADLAARPVPFFLASPLEGQPEDLGPRADWLAEWKFDGIRAQMIRFGNETSLWSRTGEAVSPAFPELVEAGRRLPDGTVLDGEILVWRKATDRPAGFGELQQRLNRKTVSAGLRSRFPAVFVAYDLPRLGGVDLRGEAQENRRSRLETLAQSWPSDGVLRLSPLLSGDWPELARLRLESRARGVEGLMLKHKEATYAAGRVKGGWFKWKSDPLSLDFVMTFAQAGHGRRSGLHTDYTFALWDGPELVTVTKAYSGLTDAEIVRVDGFVKRHTLEKFGPVRRIEPILVCEVGFEGVTRSPRHRSGFALRFPRVLRLREDKPAAEADTLENLQKLAGLGPVNEACKPSTQQEFSFGEP